MQQCNNHDSYEDEDFFAGENNETFKLSKNLESIETNLDVGA
jgi:hypothetical protein